jgi:hypothetical protein
MDPILLYPSLFTGLIGNDPPSWISSAEHGVCPVSVSWLPPNIAIVTCGWISPGRLAIRHDTQLRRPYILPFKAEGVCGLAPERLRVKSISFNQDYKERQRTNNSTNLHAGKVYQYGGKKRRAGKKQSARNETRASGHMGSHPHSLLDGMKWQARGQ